MRRDDVPRGEESRNARAVLVHRNRIVLGAQAAIEAGVVATRDAAMTREEAVRDPRQRCKAVGGERLWHRRFVGRFAPPRQQMDGYCALMLNCRTILP
jgi:hypothetical protein